MVTGGEAPPAHGGGISQYLAVGCLTLIAGFFGGGMLGVGVGMIVGNARGCVPPENSFPICDFFPYWIGGMIAGAILLPSATLWLLRRSRRGGPRHST